MSETQGLRIAVEGCGHGTLNAIYSSIQKSCEVKGWDGVDLLIIGGDFEALRNEQDLECMAVPEKYREMGDFHEYYSGKRKAPYLTIFIGGNHEASNYLWELYYGGWAAPNIYYLGAANVIRLGGLRISGLSGIWKGHDYKKPHFERLPYNKNNMRSIYHVREVDVRKLLQIKTPVDVGLSHDWPRGIEWLGNHERLFRFKAHMEPDARDATLGSPAAKYVLDRLRPRHWFSAHMHCKYTAVVEHKDPLPEESEAEGGAANSEPVHNSDEIDLDVSDNEEEKPAQPATDNKISEDLRSELPASFRNPQTVEPATPSVPEAIVNKTTKFLALDKCLPKRDFLQLLEIELEISRGSYSRPYTLEYDPEWLAITRAFASELALGGRSMNKPIQNEVEVLTEATEWVEANVVTRGKLAVPDNFEVTAPIYDPASAMPNPGQPKEYTNPQTTQFCELIGIKNKFDFSEADRAARMSSGPPPEAQRPDRGRDGRGGRGGFGGRGRGGWRGRGGPSRG